MRVSQGIHVDVLSLGDEFPCDLLEHFWESTHKGEKDGGWNFDRSDAPNGFAGDVVFCSSSQCRRSQDTSARDDRRRHLHSVRIGPEMPDKPIEEDDHAGTGLGCLKQPLAMPVVP